MRTFKEELEEKNFLLGHQGLLFTAGFSNKDRFGIGLGGSMCTGELQQAFSTKETTCNPVALSLQGIINHVQYGVVAGIHSTFGSIGAEYTTTAHDRTANTNYGLNLSITF